MTALSSLPTARAIRLSCLVPCLLALLVMSFAASAQRVEGDRARAEGAYAAEVEVNGQGAAQRNAAFSRALSRTLGKISGDRNAAARPGVGQELRRAEEYVKSYDYRQDEGVSSTGAPSFKTMLVVRFDEDKVDGLASALGVPIWPTPRPKPVLWLAIDDGSGPRLVGLQQSDAARSALDRAVARGYRLGLPNGSASEQALVGAIWRGDSATVARASQRYSPPMQLIGKLYRDGAGWASDWIFVDHGKVLSRWSESGASALSLMATGADGGADALVKRYAKASPTGPAGTYRVMVTGIDSTDDYLRLAAYLQQLPVVTALSPAAASPQGLEMDLQLVSGLAGFDHMVATGDVLAVSSSSYRDDDRLPADDVAPAGMPVDMPIQMPETRVSTYRMR